MGRRGILPSLGAGTSLIVAGVLCLALISSIIAFRGFPGLGPDAARPPVRLVAPAVDGTGRSAPAPIVVGATVGSATLAASARRPASGSRSGADRAQADRPAVRIGTAPSTGSGSSPAAPVTDPVTAPPAATPSAGQPESETEAPAATTRPRRVRETVDRVREAAAPVLQPPPAPPVVQPVVDGAAGLVETANGVVDQAAGAADDLVGSLLPPN